jgi:hypothetical protein
VVAVAVEIAEGSRYCGMVIGIMLVGELFKRQRATRLSSQIYLSYQTEGFMPCADTVPCCCTNVGAPSTPPPFWNDYNIAESFTIIYGVEVSRYLWCLLANLSTSCQASSLNFTSPVLQIMERSTIVGWIMLTNYLINLIDPESNRSIQNRSNMNYSLP